MSDSMWDSESADDFALPGDDQRTQALEGRQQAAEPDVVAEPETQAAVQEEAPGEVVDAPQEETEAPALIGGKFKSVDDLLKSYQELESDRGRLGNEVGELRRLVEERFVEQPQQPQQPFMGYGPSDDQIEDAPVEIAQWALQQGDERTYQRALTTMYESGDPTLAVQATRLELARGTAPLYQQLQELKQQHGQAQTNRDMAEWGRTHPDAKQYETRMVEIASQRPEIQQALDSGDPAMQRLALDHLYTIAASEAGPKPDNFAQAVRDAARDAQQEAADAAVITSGKAAQDAPKPTAADKLGEQWAEIEAVHAGWNI